MLCRLLHAERADLHETLAHMRRLGAAAQALPHDWVPTHGDPNRDNFLRGARGALFLTDWGALACGPPERDLFHWTGELLDVVLQQYRALRPWSRLHAELFEFYFYRWCLQEIADYGTRLLADDLGQAEAEHAWMELQEYLPIRHRGIEDGVQSVRVAIGRVYG